jgi:hypothetical protein
MRMEEELPPKVKYSAIRQEEFSEEEEEYEYFFLINSTYGRCCWIRRSPARVSVSNFIVAGFSLLPLWRGWMPSAT